MTLVFPQGDDVPSYETGGLRSGSGRRTSRRSSSPFDTRRAAARHAAGRATASWSTGSGARAARRVPYHLESRRVPGAAVERDHRRGPARGGRRQGELPGRAAHHHDVKGGGGPTSSPRSARSTTPTPTSRRRRFINNERTFLRDPAAPGDAAKLEWFCDACSFRPWLDEGDAETVDLTVRQRLTARAGGRGARRRPLGQLPVAGRGRVRLRGQGLRPRPLRQLQRRPFVRGGRRGRGRHRRMCCGGAARQRQRARPGRRIPGWCSDNGSRAA